MPSFTTITAALALAGTAITTPVAVPKGDFTVAQVERKLFVKNGPEQVIKTLRKYGKPIPAAMQKAADIGPSQSDMTALAQNGTVPAVPGDAYDSLYLSPVTLGSKTVHLDFDTGSADL